MVPGTVVLRDRPRGGTVAKVVGLDLDARLGARRVARTEAGPVQFGLLRRGHRLLLPIVPLVPIVLSRPAGPRPADRRPIRLRCGLPVVGGLITPCARQRGRVAPDRGGGG